MVVRHGRRNQNACKHTAAGTATAERSIWGQVLGTDLSRHVPMTCLLIRKESLVAATAAMKISSVLARGAPGLAQAETTRIARARALTGARRG
jgi:hypothetical protein